MDRRDLLSRTPETCERLLSLLDGLETPVAIVAPDDMVVYANPASERSTGFTLRELVGHRSSELWGELLKPHQRQELAAALLAGRPWEGAVRSDRRSGAPNTGRIRILPLEAKGESGLQGVVGEIPGTGNPDGQLPLEQVAFLEEVLEAIPNPVYIKDPGLRYRMCNRAYEDLMSVPAMALRGRMLTEAGLVDETYARAREEIDREILRTGVGRHTATQALLRDGKVHHALSWVAPLHGPDGTTTGLLGVLVDITELREKEQALAREHARAANESLAKSLFLANVSHEIRTPLNTILGQLELLSGSELQDRERERVERASLAGEALKDLVDKVLDHARAEGGMLESSTSTFLLRDLLWALEDRMRPKARSKGIGLLVEIDPELDGPLVGDGIRISQALAHLVDNAIKFTSQGGVVLTASLKERVGEALRVRLSVTDTGIGVAPDLLPRLFEPFQQADPTHTRRFGGTGLGLSLCRRLVDVLGGELSVESEPDRGSAFHMDVLLLPGSRTDADESSSRMEFAPVELRLEGQRILLVAPSSWRRGYLADQMVTEGASVQVADILEPASSLFPPSSDRPDVVLVQIDPDSPATGRFCQELRAVAPVGARRIGLVAAGAELSTESVLHLGLDGVIHEPFSIEEFHRVRDGRTAPEPDEPSIPPPPPEPLFSPPGGDPGPSPTLLHGFLETHRFDLKTVVRLVSEGHLAQARSTLSALSEAARRLGAIDLPHRAHRLQEALREETGLGEEFTATERAMHHLVRGIERLLARTRTEDDPIDPGAAAPADPAFLDRLRELLRQCDADTLDLIDTHEAELCAALGRPRARELASLVRAFEFDAALALLNATPPAEARP